MTSLGHQVVSNHWEFVCFIQQLVPVDHNGIINALHYWRFLRWLVDRPTINKTSHPISPLLILPIKNGLPCQREKRLERYSNNCVVSSRSHTFWLVNYQHCTSSILRQALSIISKPSVNSNLSNSPETLNSSQNWRLSVPCGLEIIRMTLENNWTPPQCCFKLCASFYSHLWIQTGVTVRKRPTWVKFKYFISLVTLKFDRRPWKIIGHLSLALSSFVH